MNRATFRGSRPKTGGSSSTTTRATPSRGRRDGRTHCPRHRVLGAAHRRVPPPWRGPSTSGSTPSGCSCRCWARRCRTTPGSCPTSKSPNGGTTDGRRRNRSTTDASRNRHSSRRPRAVRRLPGERRRARRRPEHLPAVLEGRARRTQTARLREGPRDGRRDNGGRKPRRPVVGGAACSTPSIGDRCTKTDPPVDDAGERIAEDRIAPGEQLTVFPEPRPGIEDAPTLLVRFEESAYGDEVRDEYTVGGYAAAFSKCTHPRGLYGRRPRRRRARLSVRPGRFDPTDGRAGRRGLAPRALPAAADHALGRRVPRRDRGLQGPIGPGGE